MNLMQIALAVSLVWSLSSGVAFAEVGVTPDEIKIGAANVLSGQSAQAGIQTDVGLNCYINEVNSKGGIFGRKIKLLTCDDKYEPDSAIACFNTLLKDGVFAFTGVYGSVCAARYIPMALNNKVPIVGFYNGTFFVSNPTKRYVFSSRCSYRDEARAAVDHLWKQGFRKFGLIYQNDAFGADCLEGMKEALKAHNAELTVASAYTRNKTDVKEAVQDVKKAEPEVVFLGAVYKPSSEIMKCAKELNWFPYLVCNTGAGIEQVILDAGDAVETGKILFTEAFPVPTNVSVPLIEKYNKALKQYFPKEKPCFASLHGYVDAVCLVEGLKRAGKDLTREGFIDALERISNLDVGLGERMPLKYSASDHLGFSNVFFGTVRNGQACDFTEWDKLRKK